MVLQIEDLHKSFGEIKALNGMSFTAREGELFGFVGSNGAGKTTAMRAILGVMSPDSGRVTWKGEPLTFEDRQNIGYMPEERGLYPKMKVADQLIYLARLHGMDKNEAERAMEYWTERLGIDSRREDAVQKLSLGNQQRCQLAAALVSHPDLLVLDEPFSGLDPVAVDVMSDVLRERARDGATVIFSSHQLELVEKLCDRVGIVSRGRIVAEGTIDELRTSDTVDYEITVSGTPDFAAAGLSARREGEDSWLVTIDPADVEAEQRALKVAQAAGPVHEFRRMRPHLTELFRGVVSSDPAPEPEKSEEKRSGLAKLFNVKLFGKRGDK